MADITRDTYDKAKNRSTVLVQKGKPVLDSELNELQNIVDEKRKDLYDLLINGAFSQGGLLIEEDAAPANNFAIAAGTLYAKNQRNNTIATSYTTQSADYTYQTEPFTVLNTPAGGDRDDLVYLDVWEEEISEVSDPSMIDPTLAVPTALRKSVKFMVKVLEGSTTLPAPAAGHVHYELAILHRVDATADILASQIEDRRKELGTLDELIIDKRSLPFKNTSAEVNLRTDTRPYGILSLNLAGCEGDREYFVSRVSRNDTSTWRIEISDSVGVVALFLTASNPESSAYVTLSEQNSSGVEGFAVIAWAQITDGFDQVYVSTDLIIQDRFCSKADIGLSASAEGTILTKYRGGVSPIYPVVGDATFRKGRVHATDIQVSTRTGDTQLVSEQEQEYPINRVDNSSVDTGSNYVVLNALNEGASHKISFSPSSLILFSQNQSRAGLYVKIVGSGYTHIRVELHDAVDAVLDSYDIPIADLTTLGAGAWIYVDLVSSLTIGQTYHFHAHMVGFTGGTSPELGVSGGGTIAHRQMYLPVSGKFNTVDTDDVIHVFDAAGSPVIAARASGEDDIVSPGDGFLGESGYDYMAIDLSSDAFWDTVEYQDYILVDLVSGRVKLPAALDVRTSAINFNVNELLNDIDAINLLRHTSDKTIEAGLIDLEESFVQHVVEVLEADEDTSVYEETINAVNSVVFPTLVILDKNPRVKFSFTARKEGAYKKKDILFDLAFTMSSADTGVVKLRASFNVVSTAGFINGENTQNIDPSDSANTPERLVTSSLKIPASAFLEGDVIEVILERDNSVASNHTGEFRLHNISMR